MTGWLQRQRPNRQWRLVTHPGPAQHRFDTGNQLPGGKGLGEIIIHPAFQSTNHIFLRIPRGEHDYRQFTGTVISP